MPPIDDLCLHQLFLDARTHNGWLPQPVEDATLRRLYDILKMAPTSANTQPVRVVFVKSAEAKERLRPCMAAGNVDKTMAAPATAIVAVDWQFHTKMPKLFPARPQMADSMASMPDAAKETFLMQNGSLQAAYLILAARALGLDCGPMGGFDKAKIDAAFFEGTSWRSILVVNLGHGDPQKLYPRNPRLDFEEACRIE